ncbi:MAG: preprotein translocase subunit SecE [Pseudomonadota bacterium]
MPLTSPKSVAMTNPFQFLQQTRAEIAKVVWPTRREVLVTTAMVFLMAVVFAIFFFGVDWVIRQLLELVLTYFG